MTLPTGARFGPYDVIAKIGEGGMGEVYRARDTRLNRDVALKVLPDTFAADAERLARFTREAQVLASLNHPNIAAIYGIEANALVMELVDGDDLSVLIARGPIAVPDALPIARQLAEALEAAHDQGIVHRDLKPANIKVRADGTVKVLDFGLAKAVDPMDGSGVSALNSPTMTARMTQMGVILGTAAYMAPEQAKGKPVDRRADIWAFGVVLHEMLSGQHLFLADTIPETLAHVMTRAADLGAVPDSAPRRIRELIARCLEKDPRQRLRDIGEARLVLENPAALDAGITEPSPAAAPTDSRRPARIWQLVTALLLVTMLAGGWAWYQGTGVAPPLSRFFIGPPDGAVFTAGARAGITLSVVSPDGRTVAFTAQDDAGKRFLWLRPIDSLTAQPIAGTEGASFPFWSPDGRSLGYSLQGSLMKVAATGGPSTRLCTLNAGIISRGGTWSPDGVIVFNNGPAPLYRVSASGGDPVVMGELSAGTAGQEFPSFLPDGRHFLYHAAGSADQGGVYVGSLDNAPAIRVVPSSTGAIYEPLRGHLLFVRQGTLLAQPFNLKTFAVSGDAVPVADKVESAIVPGVVAFSVSNTGVLTYGVGSPAGEDLQMNWVDRGGKVIGAIGPPGQYRGVSLSPDGLHIAAHRHDGDGGDIWLTEVSSGKPTRFTSDPTQENASPVWSPDSMHIAFSSTRGGKLGIYVRPVDGAGADQLLFEWDGARSVSPLSWSAEGAVLFQVPGPKTDADLWSVMVSGEHKASPLLQSPFAELHGQFSPDGRWIAYTSNETGSTEVYVQPAGGGAKRPVSIGGGNGPRWRGDSRELFYVGGGKLWAVGVTTPGGNFVPGTPAPLFNYTTSNIGVGHPVFFSYAVANNGQRFLVTGTTSGAQAPQVRMSSPIVVVINWLDRIGK